jgi:hypothetical protein
MRFTSIRHEQPKISPLIQYARKWLGGGRSAGEISPRENLPAAPTNFDTGDRNFLLTIIKYLQAEGASLPNTALSPLIRLCLLKTDSEYPKTPSPIFNPILDHTTFALERRVQETRFIL